MFAQMFLQGLNFPSENCNAADVIWCFSFANYFINICFRVHGDVVGAVALLLVGSTGHFGSDISSFELPCCDAMVLDIPCCCIIDKYWCICWRCSGVIVGSFDSRSSSLHLAYVFASCRCPIDSLCFEFASDTIILLGVFCFRMNGSKRIGTSEMKQSIEFGSEYDIHSSKNEQS